MALHKLVRSNCGRKLLVSIKYQNLHSFKEEVILLSEYPWNETNITFTWLSSLCNPFKPCMLCFQMFQHVTVSSNISSLQSMLRFQTSCMNIFGLSMAGEIIPKGSNMLLVKLSIPRFVFGTSLYKHFFKWYFIEVKIYWFWW